MKKKIVLKNIGKYFKKLNNDLKKLNKYHGNVMYGNIMYGMYGDSLVLSRDDF